MKKTRIIVVAAVVAGACLMARQRTVAQTGGGGMSKGGLRMAVCDVSHIIRHSKEAIGRGKKFKAKSDASAAKVNELAEEVKKAQARLEQIKEGTKDFEEQLTKFREILVRLEVYERTVKGDLQRERYLTVKELYEDILKASGAVAKEQGIDLVFYQPEELAPSSKLSPLGNLQARISSNLVIYKSPRSDITQAVLDKLDSEFETQ